jgi:hypothetical protein
MKKKQEWNYLFDIDKDYIEQFEKWRKIAIK